MIDLVDEAEQRFVLVIERRGFQVFEDSENQFLAAEQFRRNCGV
jgi:hypothetical protein